MNVIQSSVTTGILIVIIIVLRAVAKNRLPKATFLILWCAALVKLFLPFSIPSSFSVYNLAPTISDPTIRNAVATMNLTLVKPVIWPFIMIWLVGALSLGIFFSITFNKYKKQVRTALPIQYSTNINKWLQELHLHRPIRILRCDQLTTPIACGVFRPKIILPSFIDLEDTQQLDYILTHELVHIKRFDEIWRFILIASLCIYWFNPAVWLMYRYACRDLELSCDEKVIRLLGEDSKTGYARSMVSMAEHRSRRELIYNGFMMNAAEERIISVMKYKKMTNIAYLTALILIVGVVGAFASSANTGTGMNAAGGPFDNATVNGKSVSSVNSSDAFIWPDNYISFKKTGTT